MTQTVLLVDDENDIREVLSLSLLDMGYEVCEACSGCEALDVFKDACPDIVLTDIKMPGMDGIELLQKVKNENPETEVIMITGHGDMDLAIKSLKHEATDFILKPINVNVLEIALRRACERILTRRRLREYTEHLEQLIKEKTELQSHLSSLGLMIGSISHGIKGLMTGLDAGIYLVESGFKKEDQARIEEGWEVVTATVAKIRKMVMDILFCSKERQLTLEHIDVKAFTAELIKELTPKIDHQNIAFIQQFAPNPGDMLIDAAYFHSALVNIVDNAIDACMRDETETKPKIEFRVSADDRQVVFEIGDNGVGMDRETQEKIFTPFFSSKGSEGTGLGLFIANTVITQHGGSIQVKSTVGRGTVFRVQIPKQNK
jgi:signal transduction histidine kinase